MNINLVTSSFLFQSNSIEHMARSHDCGGAPDRVSSGINDRSVESFNHCNWKVIVLRFFTRRPAGLLRSMPQGLPSREGELNPSDFRPPSRLICFWTRGIVSVDSPTWPTSLWLSLYCCQNHCRIFSEPFGLKDSFKNTVELLPLSIPLASRLSLLSPLALVTFSYLRSLPLL